MFIDIPSNFKKISTSIYCVIERQITASESINCKSVNSEHKADSYFLLEVITRDNQIK